MTARIILSPAPGRLVARLGETVLADSRAALILEEQGLAPVIYFPRADIRMDLARPSERTSRCPWKGEARYWSIEADGQRHADVLWAYDAPLESVAALAEHAAFWAGKLGPGFRIDTVAEAA